MMEMRNFVIKMNSSCWEPTGIEKDPARSKAAHGQHDISNMK
jgi:hypothetical protein